MVIFYRIFRGCTWLLSRLPFPVLYFIAGILKFLLHNIFRYRRKTTLQNLEKSFPEKSRKEIHQILSRFYRNLAEITVEVIKLETGIFFAMLFVFLRCKATAIGDTFYDYC